jgi:hypothetical protein
MSSELTSPKSCLLSYRWKGWDAGGCICGRSFEVGRTWEQFLEQPTKSFINKEEGRSLKQMDYLQQGKGTTAEYFMKFEHLSHQGRKLLEDSEHVILQIKQVVHPCQDAA